MEQIILSLVTLFCEWLLLSIALGNVDLQFLLSAPRRHSLATPNVEMAESKQSGLSSVELFQRRFRYFTLKISLHFSLPTGCWANAQVLSFFSLDLCNLIAGYLPRSETATPGSNAELLFEFAPDGEIFFANQCLGVAVNPANGQIWVAQQGAMRGTVHVFNAEGRFLFTVTRRKRHFPIPKDICFAGDGNVCVADADGVVVCRAVDGSFVRKLKLPKASFLFGWSVASNGKGLVFVTSHLDDRVRVFKLDKADGDDVRQWRQHHHSDQEMPQGFAPAIAVSKSDEVAVHFMSDTGRVQVRSAFIFSLCFGVTLAFRFLAFWLA